MHQFACNCHFKPSRDLRGPFASYLQLAWELLFKFLLELSILGTVSSGPTVNHPHFERHGSWLRRGTGRLRGEPGPER